MRLTGNVDTNRKEADMTHESQMTLNFHWVS
jgi:hypothetical protein